LVNSISLFFIFLALIGSSVLRPLCSGTGQYLGLTECIVCSDQDGAHLIIAKRDLEKHKRSERHRSDVVRLELERTTRQNRVSAGTDALQVPTGSGDDDQAFGYSMGDTGPHPYTSIDVGVVTDEDVIMSIADAPAKLPEPSQGYYDEYRAAVLQGERLFEVRLPPSREPDDVKLDHNGDLI
jgi:hypothetical protein